MCIVLQPKRVLAKHSWYVMLPYLALNVSTLPSC